MLNFVITTPNDRAIEWLSVGGTIPIHSYQGKTCCNMLIASHYIPQVLQS